MTASEPDEQRYLDWRYYGGDSGGSKYSPLIKSTGRMLPN
jgi:hypothetical protein